MNTDFLCPWKLSKKNPKTGLARRNKKGKIDVMSPITTSETPSCFPNTTAYGSIGPIPKQTKNNNNK